MNGNPIGEAMRAAAGSIRINPEDYERDGLLYCGKCHTPKQTRVEILGNVITPMCLCKCEEEAQNRRDETEKAERRTARIAELRKSGFTESSLMDCTFSKDDTPQSKISVISRNYVENFDQMKESGKGLLFFGDVGTGKTFFAACIVNALINRCRPCLMTNVTRLVNDLSEMRYGKQYYLDRLNSCDLLVLDDLATERNTEYMNEMAQNIIDSRYRAHKPLIVTTNLTADELKKPVDMHRQRMYSRLMEMCIPVEIKGADRRRKKLKKDFSEMDQILGLSNKDGGQGK